MRDHVRPRLGVGDAYCEHRTISDLLKLKWESDGIRCVTESVRELGFMLASFSFGTLFLHYTIDAPSLEVDATSLSMRVPVRFLVRYFYSTVAELLLTAKLGYRNIGGQWRLSFGVQDIKVRDEVLKILCVQDPSNKACRRRIPQIRKLSEFMP